MEAQTTTEFRPKTSIADSALTLTWTGETIRTARKAKKLTQMDLAFALGCRQQTISEWEIGLYAPKNAYQKLLSQYFRATEGKGAQEVPDLSPLGSFTVTIDQLEGVIKHMRFSEVCEMRIAFDHAQDTFTMFGAPAGAAHLTA